MSTITSEEREILTQRVLGAWVASLCDEHGHITHAEAAKLAAEIWKPLYAETPAAFCR